MIDRGSRLTIDALLAASRAGLRRLTPTQAYSAMTQGALLVDIRASDQRRVDGVIPGSIWFPRNVLEWRIDPSSSASDPAVADLNRAIVLLCAQGYQTSLAAATLQDLGFQKATDVIDGFEGWQRTGLPTVPFDDDEHLRIGSRRFA
jgi:rhodanese-related sulfurtransferase